LLPLAFFTDASSARFNVSGAYGVTRVAHKAGAHAIQVRGLAATQFATPDTSFHVFAATDFERGVLDRGWIDVYKGALPGEFTIVPDPTNSGHGKVGRFAYFTNAAGGFIDNNYAIQPDYNLPSVHATNGDEVLFEGDVYFVKNATDSIINLHGLRKLTYWCSGPDPHSCTNLTSQGSGTATGNEPLNSTIVAQGPSNLPCDCPYYNTLLTTNAWHHVLIDIRFGAIGGLRDGGYRVVWDGVTITNRNDVQWVDPRSKKPLDWYDWRVGQQLNCAVTCAEVRYWDNLKFSIKRRG